MTVVYSDAVLKKNRVGKDAKSKGIPMALGQRLPENGLLPKSGAANGRRFCRNIVSTRYCPGEYYQVLLLFFF